MKIHISTLAFKYINRDIHINISVCVFVYVDIYREICQSTYQMLTIVKTILVGVEFNFYLCSCGVFLYHKHVTEK